MIKAHIRVKRELSIKGYLRYGRQAIGQYAPYYSLRAFYLWLAVGLIDILFDARDLLTPHLLVISLLAVGASVWSYREWRRKVFQAEDFEYDIELDDDGVYFPERDALRPWSEYVHYEEFDDYIEFKMKDGSISFVPLTDELNEVIEFSKSKIARKSD